MNAALLLLALLVQDDSLEKARKLIEESAAKIKAAPALAFESEVISGEAGGSATRVPSRSAFLVQAPDKLRWETSGGGNERLYIWDGKNIWSLDRAANEYTRQPQPANTLKITAADNPLLRFFLDKDPLRLLEKAKDVAVTQRKEGEATFDVIAWKARDPYGRDWTVDYTLWLDPARLPRRYTKSWMWQGRLDMQDTDFMKVDLAPKLADDTFTFKPPEGSREKQPHSGTAYEIPDTEGARAAQKLLIEVHKAFKASDAVTYETITTSTSGDDETQPPRKSVTALKRPDFMRQTMTSEYGDYTTLADGESMWTLATPGQNFTRRDLTTAAHRLYMRVDPMCHVFFEGERPEILGGGMKEIAVAKDTFDGETCEVVEWSFPQPGYQMKTRLFIGADRRPRQLTVESNYKDKLYRTVSVYKAFDVKPKLTKESFTFKPGPGWTDRSNEQLGETMIPAGKPAPDFEAVDSAGKTVNLSSFKGTPVVLVFGYYSLAAEFPRVQEFHEEFSKRGITVIAVSVQEKSPRPDPKKYTFPLLRLKDKSVAKTYGVDYFISGMYLLDADQKVLAATYGNDALKKAVEDMIK